MLHINCNLNTESELRAREGERKAALALRVHEKEICQHEGLFRCRQTVIWRKKCVSEDVAPAACAYHGKSFREFSHI